nr:hypothetical protein [Tanacetum cinerariifolium]
ALKLTPFYNAFDISADVPEIYMQEFWVTVSRHHSSLRFKLNGKSHTVNVDNFIDMLKICPKLPGRIFEEPPPEEAILSFLRDLRHTREIKFLSDVNINHMHQPWRSLDAISNKCLHGKTTTLERVFLSPDQRKLATKRSKKEFHSSHASGSGDGVDILSKVPDKQQQPVSGTNEGAGDKPENVSRETESNDDGDDFVYPNLSTYNADDQEEEDEEEKTNDDDEVSSDQNVSTPPDYEILDEQDNQEDDDTVIGGEQEDEEDKELYRDLNLNLNRRDAKITDAQINQETEEVYVTLTTELLVVQQQSSYVSSDLVSKFINPTFDTGIDSILNPNVQSDIPVNASVSITTETPSYDTLTSQPPIPII